MDRRDILKHIEGSSPHYTPEWRFDAGSRDMGAAFALTFADMFSETHSKYQRLMDKHHIEFINATGIEPIQKQAAEGYVCFSLAHGAPEGCLVDKGTPVYSEDDIVFTTAGKTYITPSKLQDVYYRIGDCFYRTGGGEEPLALFGKAENLQRHDLYIGHEWLFELNQKAEICVTADGDSLDLLGDGGTVCWQYYTGEWTEFSRLQYDGGRIILNTEQPFVKTEISECEAFFIRCRALNPMAAEILLKDIFLKIRNPEPVVRKIYQDSLEILEDEFYPFGKSLSSFSCYYIASTEAFGKKFSKVKISFDLALVSQEIQNPAPEIPVQWRAIVHKRELEPPPVYDVTIDSVALEYWNGRDFVTLAAEEPVKQLFSHDGAQKSITFQCPEDMPLMAMYGFESRWVRLRILNVTNEYKINSRHIAPYISNLTISYEYEEELPACTVYAENNGERLNDLPFMPFSFLPENEYAVYFGFDKPFDGSPIGFLWDVEPYKARHEIRWYTFSGGKWKPIIVRGDFWRTGYTTHYQDEQMEPCLCFGKERYWMLAKIGDRPTAELRIRKLYSGAVPVVQKTEEQTVYLSIHAKDTTKLFSVDTDRLCDLRVSVDECDELNRQNFVKWREDDENSYKILNEGIFFGEDALHRIYRHKDTPVIKIRFRMTEGELGNAKTISKIGRSIGYISSVTNPLPISGGRGLEPVERILSRGGGKLVDRNRAVTTRAYESLVLESSVDIVKCICIAGVSENGDSLNGAVTVVYLSKDFDTNSRRTASIQTYLVNRAPPQAKVFVREPIFVEISVTARITTQNRFVIKVRELVERGLDEFLHPILGNFDKKGFSIGEIPRSDHILSYLYSFDAAAHVDGFGVTFVGTADLIREEIDIDAFSNIRFCVPVSGTHHIKVVHHDSKLKS